MKAETSDYLRLVTESPSEILRIARKNAIYLKNRYKTAVHHKDWRTLPRVLLLIVSGMILTAIDVIRYDADFHEDMDDTLDEMLLRNSA